MRLKLFLVVALSLFAASANANLEDAANAVCLITTPKAVGTGFAYKEDTEYVYILTAGHITGINGPDTRLKLFHNGAQWNNVACECIFNQYHERDYSLEQTNKDIDNGIIDLCKDVSVVRLKKDKELAKYGGFTVLPFALNYNEKPNTLIWSYGCPDGNWPSGFKGRLAKINNHLVQFTPRVIPGRSGSPLLDARCEKVIGIVVMCSSDKSHASRIDDVYDILKTKGLEPDVLRNTDIRTGTDKIGSKN